MSRRRYHHKNEFRLTFTIQHLMVLVLASALALAFRNFLGFALVRSQGLIVWGSGITTVASFLGLYAVAFMGPDALEHAARIFNNLVYALILSGVLFVTSALILEYRGL